MLKLQAGDFFCTENPMALGKAIRFIERLRDHEKSVYSHSGIITDPTGITLEALWTVRGNHLNAYQGDQLIIGRWVDLTSNGLEKGYEAISPEVDTEYPFWRLVFFMTPRACQQYVSTGKYAVCSELTCKFLFGAGCTDLPTWEAQDPQNVADLIAKGKRMVKIFEGTWSPSLLLEGV
jgi:hypothetical protein